MYVDVVSSMQRETVDLVTVDTEAYSAMLFGDLCRQMQQKLMDSARACLWICLESKRKDCAVANSITHCH